MSTRQSIQHPFRALRSRDFLLYWAGQGTSVIGTWMQSMALSWLVYRVTNSPLVLGVLTLARFGPSLVFAPFAGFIVDRFPKRRMVLFTQSCALILASTLTILVLGRWIHIWQILVLALLQGFVDTLDMTARQAFQLDLVPQEDLQSAVSLNSAAFNTGRMVGPALAGVAIHLWGEGPCFAINAFSYLAVLASLFTIRGRAEAPKQRTDSVLANIRDGLVYVWKDKPALARVMAMATTSLVGLSVYTLLPVFARELLGGGAGVYGMLLGASGVGAIAGSLIAAAGPSPRATGQGYAHCLLAIGISLAGFGYSRSLSLSMLSLVIVGVAVAIQMAHTNTYLQTTAPPAMRGRVISVYIWVFAGFTPIGGMLVGWAAQHGGGHGGAQVTAMVSGFLCALAGLAFYTRSKALKK